MNRLHGAGYIYGALGVGMALGGFSGGALVCMGAMFGAIIAGTVVEMLRDHLSALSEHQSLPLRGEPQ